jgi:hypothetical protein
MIDPTNPTRQDLVFCGARRNGLGIHIDKPWGTLLAQVSGRSGSAFTGMWLQDGMRFYFAGCVEGSPR